MHTALVTGGSRGIGYAIAQAILADGGRVMITGRDQGRVDAAVEALAAGAADASCVAGRAVDVRDRASVETLIADVVTRFGAFDTLVNNAGVGVFAEVTTLTDEDWDRVIQTNLTGVFYCCRAAIPRLRDAGGGWIINVASLAGRNYFPGGAAYCASKAGLIAFSEALMQEVRADGIRVSVIMPGSVDTDFSRHRDEKSDTSWKLRPEDVAETVMSLLRHPAHSLPSRIEIRPAKTK
jgi:3-oxoacyl-[acyl-carrier protein] reductase